MKKLRELIKIYTSPIFFILGYILFIFSKKNPNFIQQSYVKSYCLTSGFVSELITSFIKIKNKTKYSKNSNPKDTELSKLQNKGYVVLENYIDQRPFPREFQSQ